MKEAKVILGSDHAGFAMKEKLKSHFLRHDIPYHDLGPYKLNKNDDYPDYAFKVASSVAQKKGTKGILICGSGAGVVIAANKVKGIRAVAVNNRYEAKMSRSHNDANVLGLSGRELSFPKLKDLVMVWLKTPFSNESRHKRRLTKIAAYES